jgi:hypothetical protein
MKYYKLNNEVFAFELDGSQDELITKDMIKMSDDEVDRHINPYKYLSASQQYQLYLSSLRPLSRKQFKLVLLDSGLLDDLELSISNIENTLEKKRIEIEYTESTEFVRTSESVKTMFTLINQTEEQINELWEKALAL